MKAKSYWYILCLIFFCLVSCTGKSTNILTLSSETGETSDNGYVVIISTDANNRSLSIYDTNGSFLAFTHFREEGLTPRGLAALNESTILVSGDATDAIYSVDLSGNKSLFYGSAQFSGNIYDLQYDSVSDIVYAIETNRIEAFNSDGTRNVAKYITTTVGACTLNNPLGMTINTNGNLVVTDTGGTDELLFYDITTTPPTCLNTVPFPNNPQGILQHSDGFLYITSSTNDRIYRTNADGSNSQVIWPTDTSVINRPTSLAELPNGNLIVGAADSDTIEEITTAGVRVGVTPFILTPFSLNVSDIIVIG